MNTINKRAPGRREKVYFNKGRQLDLSAFEEAKKILDPYRPFKKDMLIEYLHLFNDKFHGLYAKHLRAIAELTKISMSEVYEVATSPNGLNINNKCGSTFPNKIKTLVKKYRVNLGISLDGDADRVILSDENGSIIDGDQIIAMLGKRWKQKKILKGGVVGT